MQVQINIEPSVWVTLPTWASGWSGATTINWPCYADTSWSFNSWFHVRVSVDSLVSTEKCTWLPQLWEMWWTGVSWRAVTGNCCSVGSVIFYRVLQPLKWSKEPLFHTGITRETFKQWLKSYSNVEVPSSLFNSRTPISSSLAFLWLCLWSSWEINPLAVLWESLWITPFSFEPLSNSAKQLGHV